MYEIKLDEYRCLGIKSGSKVQLRSRNDNDFTLRYTKITQGLEPLPNETVVDGEVVALDATEKPSFNALQNFRPSQAPLLFLYFRYSHTRWTQRNGRTA